MNATSKSYKLFKLLKSNGVVEADAYRISTQVVAPTLTVSTRKVNKTAAPIHLTVRERVEQYVKKQGGRVWQLQGLARALNMDPNQLSPVLTEMKRKGYLNHTGFGEWCKA